MERRTDGSQDHDACAQCSPLLHLAPAFLSMSGASLLHLLMLVTTLVQGGGATSQQSVGAQTGDFLFMGLRRAPSQGQDDSTGAARTSMLFVLVWKVFRISVRAPIAICELSGSARSARGRVQGSKQSILKRARRTSVWQVSCGISRHVIAIASDAGGCCHQRRGERGCGASI